MITIHEFLRSRGVMSIRDTFMAIEIERMLKDYAKDTILECGEIANREICKDYNPARDIKVKIYELINQL